VSPLRAGSLCTGYGGLDMAVARVLDTKTVWVSEINPGAALVLHSRFRGITNLGDLRKVAWEKAGLVDVVTAGFPCQPVSCAGKRAGMADSRWLWDSIADALERMKAPPRLVILENVRGLLTANHGAAWAHVTGDLRRLGYHVSHVMVRASETGAPHRRERVFVLARLAGKPLVLAVLPPRIVGRGVNWPHDHATRWGEYEPVIRRWERVLGQPAPAPCEPAPGSGKRLSPRFEEWCMGLPDRWVTGVPGLGWHEQLTILGNGVVPQQAELALRRLLGGRRGTQTTEATRSRIMHDKEAA
jgi:DNA (cytosine-5)-methyltransferase 1